MEIGRGMDPCLLYRVLRMFQGSGLAESSLDDTGVGPARRAYRLTPEGIEILDLWIPGIDDMLASPKRLKVRYHKMQNRRRI